MRRILPRTAFALAALLAHPGAEAQVIGKAGAVELTEADVRGLVAALPGETRAVLAADDAALERFVRGELARRLLPATGSRRSSSRSPTVPRPRR
jgi:hypothetical protein